MLHVAAGFRDAIGIKLVILELKLLQRFGQELSSCQNLHTEDCSQSVFMRPQRVLYKKKKGDVSKPSSLGNFLYPLCWTIFQAIWGHCLHM